MNLHKVLLIVGLSAMLTPIGSALAGPIIQFDEWGNGVGTVGQGILVAPDPTGGLPDYPAWPVLIYTLPFNGVGGDIALTDPTVGTEDIVRFVGNGQVVFYSDSNNGPDAPADTPHSPTNVNAVVVLPEVGQEDVADGVVYTPLPGQPGWDPSGPTYNIVSDGVVPEPATMALLALGGLGMMGGRLVRRRR